MATSVTWTNAAGTAYSLSNGTYCYHLGHTGVGMPRIRRLTRRAYNQIGVSDVGWRADARFFSLLVEIVGTSYSNLGSKRRTMSEFLAPELTTAADVTYLTFTDHSYVTPLTIVCRYIGGLEANYIGGQGFVQQYNLQFMAADPRFSGTTGYFTGFAAAPVNSYRMIANAEGFSPHAIPDAPSEFTLTMAADGTSGTITGMTIRSTITSTPEYATVTLSGLSIVSGKSIIVNRSAGTIVDSDGNNLWQYVTSGSDWARLWLANAGAMAIGYTSGSGAPLLTLASTTRYWSL